MNRKMRRVLVAIREIDHVPVSQLRKAASIARAAGAHLELFHVNSEPLLPDEPRRGERRYGAGRGSIEERLRRSRARLERLRSSPIFKGLQVVAHIARDYPPHEAIVRRVQASGADLVVAASRRRHLAGRLFLMNTDWELIRSCPCPILFVKARGNYSKPVLLAAVDPFHANAKPARLDPQLLRFALSFGNSLMGQVHVFHAYRPLAFGFFTSIEQSPVILPPGAEATNTARVARAFNRLAQSAHIPPRRRHLAMGDVASALLRAVRQVGADIVVMGAVSRAGLKRFFIGSTAERVLDELRCDVLIVKAPGFKALRTHGRLASPSGASYT